MRDVEAEIGLLIPSDVPQILDPLEVRHCQDGGPYASRTIVDWVVNGPLGCRNHCSRIPSFFVKADQDLNQMVKDYYNIDFPVSSADLPKLSKFSVERCLKPDGFGVITSSQLHHFADASEIGYGSVSCLRLVNGRNEAHCSFLCTKSRVGPLKMVTIPRLELSAAVTAVKQDRLLKRELEISVDARSVFWTDSTAVLRYVKNETNRYHTFVANSVAIIRYGSQPNQWCHVNGDNNPADDASRGLTAGIFLRQTRWLTGPAFRWKHDSMWPTQDELFGEIANDDPEVKREVRAGVSSLSIRRSPLLQYAGRCSSWSLFW